MSGSETEVLLIVIAVFMALLLFLVTAKCIVLKFKLV